NEQRESRPAARKGAAIPPIRQHDFRPLRRILRKIAVVRPILSQYRKGGPELVQPQGRISPLSHKGRGSQMPTAGHHFGDMSQPGFLPNRVSTGGRASALRDGCLPAETWDLGRSRASKQALTWGRGARRQASSAQ